MKQLTVKNKARAELEREVQEFLQRGGAVTAVARGVSGRDSNDVLRPSKAFRSFEPRPREERTYVPEVVAAIESRRKKPKERKVTTGKTPRLVKKAILDDFGEPVRYEWIEK